MNDIERRTLIGAAGLGAIAAFAKAGPLTPPAGAVAGTGRTTDEIYNKIPAVGGADGRTPIAGGTATVTISQPGSYVLTGNITVGAGSTGLSITASGVTVDLNGFRITQTAASSSSPMGIATGLSGVTVRNGSLAGGSIGIGTGNNVIGLLLEDISVFNAKVLGIGLATGCRECVIRRCHVYDTGSTTTASDTNASVTGISNLSAIGTRIEDCVVSRLFNNGTGTLATRGIFGGGSGCSISGCQVFHDAANNGTGIVHSGSVYRNNTVLNFASNYAGTGTDGGGNF